MRISVRGRLPRFQKNQLIEDIFHSWLLEACNSYLIIGGMPECVASWVACKDPARILMVFRSIVSQLARPNGKFLYGAVREGRSAASFQACVAKKQPRYALRFSKRGFRRDGAFTNLPLYLGAQNEGAAVSGCGFVRLLFCTDFLCAKALFFVKMTLANGAAISYYLINI